jgi:Carbamoyltransferase N-terminus
MLILGLNMFHADASDAIVQDGEVVFAIAEERLNRAKHYAGFPSPAVKGCLDAVGAKVTDISHVAVGQDTDANLAKKVRYALAKTPPPVKRLLLIVPVVLRGTFIRRCEEAKKSVRLAADACGKEQPVARSGTFVVAKAQSPQAIVLQPMSICIAEQAIEVSALGVVDSNLSAACVADQQVVAEESEVRRRNRNPPWRIEPRSLFQSL